jgi:lysylphosphatidylglycerol synthetase-like protein (DUF2156 family)
MRHIHRLAPRLRAAQPPQGAHFADMKATSASSSSDVISRSSNAGMAPPLFCASGDSEHRDGRPRASPKSVEALEQCGHGCQAHSPRDGAGQPLVMRRVSCPCALDDLAGDTGRRLSNTRLCGNMLQRPRLQRSVFSIAPVLLVVIAVAGLVLGTEAAQGRVVEQLRGLIGTDGASAVQTMIVNASHRKSGVVATIIGIATLLVGATGVMVELKEALNTVWKVKTDPDQKVTAVLRARLLSLGLIIALGFLLLVSMAVSAVLAAISGWLATFMPEWAVLAFLLDYGVSILAIAAFLALASCSPLAGQVRRTRHRRSAPR